MDGERINWQDWLICLQIVPKKYPAPANRIVKNTNFNHLLTFLSSSQPIELKSVIG